MKRISRPIDRLLTIEELKEWVKAPHPDDRSFAARELQMHDDPKTAELLIEMLYDPEPSVRGAAAYSLGTVGREPGTALAAKQSTNRLIALLEDNDEEVVAAAVYALGRLGNSDIGPKLLPYLEYANTPYLKMRNVAIEALRTLGYQPAIPHFRRLLHNPDPGVRTEALRALFSLRQVDTDVERILKSLVDKNDPLLTETAQTMLDIIAEEKLPK